MRNAISTPSAVLAALFSLVLASATTAQELRREVGALLEQSDTVEVAELYSLSLELADLAPERNLDGYLR